MKENGEETTIKRINGKKPTIQRIAGRAADLFELSDNLIAKIEAQLRAVDESFKKSIVENLKVIYQSGRKEIKEEEDKALTS